MTYLCPQLTTNVVILQRLLRKGDAFCAFPAVKTEYLADFC